jgi:ABC-type sugar transport system substrate-binding protein
MNETVNGSSGAQAANWEAGVNLGGLRMPGTIGVCINFGAHIWYQVLSSVERDLGEELGISIHAVDAAMDSDVQAEQVKGLVAEGVDALIYSAADPAKAPTILEPARAVRLPVIAEAIWLDIPAVTTNVMINDYAGGQKVGRLAAERLRARSEVNATVLDVTVPWLDEAVRRSDGFFAGLRETFPAAQRVQVDGRAEIETSAAVTEEALQHDRTFNLIFGVDDESVIGARQGYERLQIPLEDVVLCSFGLSGPHGYDLLASGAFDVVCAMFPEYVARMAIHAAIYAYNRRPLPRHLAAPTVALTAEKLGQYYTRVPDGVRLSYQAVQEVSTHGEERS